MPSVYQPAVKLCGVLLLVCALPLPGLLFVDAPLEPYFLFPPKDHKYIQQREFSWQVFCGLVLGLAIFLRAALRRLGKPRLKKPVRASDSLPRWAILALLFLALSWILAWSRLSWFAPLQRHTFVFLWLSYIIAANGVLVKLRGSAPLTANTRRYLLLFPASALLWWGFEWLNRFVQNWIYHGIESFTAAEYLLFATISFSTVLPAVFISKLLVAELLAVSPGTGPGARAAFRIASTKAVAAITGAALLLLPLFPQQLYPFLWIAPLLALMPLAARAGAVFSNEAAWHWMLAGLWCGFLWELWNWRSLAKWTYHISYVQALHLFEMPLLGYAGYLPFGLLCGLVVRLLAASGSAADPHPNVDHTAA